MHLIISRLLRDDLSFVTRAVIPLLLKVRGETADAKSTFIHFLIMLVAMYASYDL
jgi:hypothetical protein